MKIKNIYTAVVVLLLSLLNFEVAFAAEETISNSNTAWILTSTALVLFMTLPGLAFFLWRTSEK